MKIRFIFPLTALLAIAGCTKASTDPSSPDPEIPEDPVHTCDSLIFVPAQEATASVDGRIAHWHCDGCNKNYLDENATQELAGLPILPAKCHSIPKDVLAKCNDFLPWRQQPQTKAKVGAVVGKVLDIVYKVTTKKSTADTQAAIADLAETLSDICTDLDDIQNELGQMDTKIDDIMAYLEVADDKEIIKAAYDYLKPLFETTVRYYTSFKYLSEDYKSGKMDESTYKATLLNDVEYWATKETSKGITMMDITKDVMDIFEGNLSGVSEKPFTESLKNYVNYYRYWDDEGYSDRAQFLRFYETTAAISEFLLQIYTNNCDIPKYKNNDYLRIADSTAFAQSLAVFPPSITADSTNIAKAYDLYRHYHNNSIEFYLDPIARSASMYDYLNSQINSSGCYFNCITTDDTNYRNLMICNLINPFFTGLTGAGATDFITDDEVNIIYETANANGGGETLTQIFAEHGMNMNPLSIDKPVLFTCRSENVVYDREVPSRQDEFQESALVNGFYIDYYAGAHPLQRHTNEEGYFFYSYTKYLHMYMDYCHDDSNNIVKHSTSSDDGLRTAVLKDVKWANWTDDQGQWCECCMKYDIHRSMGTTPDARARYTTTFRYYQGTEFPD